jgi:hypothetical protein
MTNLATAPQTTTPGGPTPVNVRANALADRLEQGARALAAFAASLTDAQWQTPVPEMAGRLG